jgi:hypothetical protein
LANEDSGLEDSSDLVMLNQSFNTSIELLETQECSILKWNNLPFFIENKEYIQPPLLVYRSLQKSKRRGVSTHYKEEDGGNHNNKKNIDFSLLQDLHLDTCIIPRLSTPCSHCQLSNHHIIGYAVFDNSKVFCSDTCYYQYYK